MIVEITRFTRAFVLFVLFLLLFVGGLAVGISPSHAAPFAAMVIDARNGEVIHARNHDTKLHPASLTKMMTLYVVFEAIKHGEITLDTPVTISRNAAGESCVCLGLRPGQTIALRYLIRAAAVRSANDAATALGEAISGSEAAFTERMTRTARAMGMSNTTFRNAHGLTAPGHLSTARDMTTLGRQLYFDYPQYYNLFSRRSADAGVATVANTNRRFLEAYRGADGIKTGYTRAAGFNLTGSAQRDGVHIIATVFGGASTAQRNAQVSELLDMGFARASRQVVVRAPATPGYQGRGAVAVAQAQAQSERAPDMRGPARTIRLQTAVRTSPRPRPRPVMEPADEFLLAVQQSVSAAANEMAEAFADTSGAPPQTDTVQTAAAQPADPQMSSLDEEAVAMAALAPESLLVTPPARDASLPVVSGDVPTQIARDLELAEAAGFSVLAPEDLALIDALDGDGTVDIARQVVAAAGAELSGPDDDADQQVVAVSTYGTLDPAGDGALIPVENPLEIAAHAEQVPPVTTTETIARAQTPPPARPENQSPQVATDSIEIAVAEGAGFGESSTGISQAAFTAGSDASAPQKSIIGAHVDLDHTPRLATANAQIILTSTDDLALPASVVQEQVTASLPMGAEIITRVSTSDAGRLWSVSFGAFPSRDAAERSLIANSLAEAASLGNGVRRVQQRSGGFHATVAGLTETEASRACMRLSARRQNCEITVP